MARVRPPSVRGPDATERDERLLAGGQSGSHRAAGRQYPLPLQQRRLIRELDRRHPTKTSRPAWGVEYPLEAASALTISSIAVVQCPSYLCAAQVWHQPILQKLISPSFPRTKEGASNRSRAPTAQPHLQMRCLNRQNRIEVHEMQPQKHRQARRLANASQAVTSIFEIFFPRASVLAHRPKRPWWLHRDWPEAPLSP